MDEKPSSTRRVPDPADSNGRSLKERLTRRLTRELGPTEAKDRVWELTVQLVQTEDGRRRAEERLDKARAQLEQLRARRGAAPEAGAVASALQDDLKKARSRLNETERALAEARERIDELERHLAGETESHRRVETELATTRERLQQASSLLQEIEKAYLVGRKGFNGPP
jgi:predicted  nucleic acid-binding Zn-ribbon protein